MLAQERTSRTGIAGFAEELFALATTRNVFFDRVALVFAICLGTVVFGGYLAARKAMFDIGYEVDQRLNLSYASRIEPFIRPHITEVVRCDDLRPVLRKLEEASGRYRLYLVDENYLIQCSTQDLSTAKHYDAIPLYVIERLLLRGVDAVPLRINDPRSPSELKHFSAASTDINGRR